VKGKEVHCEDAGKTCKMPLAVFLGIFREYFRGDTNVYSTCRN
jgi:hypothetical protein